MQYQLQQAAPFMVHLEDDVNVQQGWLHWLSFVCRLYNGDCPERGKWMAVCERHRTRKPDVVQLASYVEVMLTPLHGARRLIALLQAHGIRKNPDHQLLTHEVMGSVVLRYTPFLSRPREQRPWVLARGSNAFDGDIISSNGLRHEQVLLLRQLTEPAFCSDPRSQAQWTRRLTELRRASSRGRFKAQYEPFVQVGRVKCVQGLDNSSVHGTWVRGSASGWARIGRRE